MDGQSGTTGIAPGSAGDVVGSSPPPVGDASSGCTLDDDAVAVQVERVETLLAAVRDIVSSLGATSAQLEREVAQALRPPPAGVAHPSPRRAGAAHVAADRTAGRHGAETTAGHESLEAERAALLEAVEHRAVIEQAKGMLMLKHRCDADAAFNLLLEISRRERRKVRDIAADLVRAGSTPRPLVDLTAHNGHSPATAGAPGDDEAGSRDR